MWGLSRRDDVRQYFLRLLNAEWFNSIFCFFRKLIGI